MSLYNKIWVTRKSRIYAEKRLILTGKILNWSSIWYSAVLVFQSISNLLYPNKNSDLFIIYSSIFVLIATVIIETQNYSDRAIAMRNCYIKLDQLSAKIKRAEDSNDTLALKEFEDEYASILIGIENHTDYDYLCFRYSQRNNENCTIPKLTFTECFGFWLLQLGNVLLVTIIILLPIIIMIFLHK